MYDNETWDGEEWLGNDNNKRKHGKYYTISYFKIV